MFTRVLWFTAGSFFSYVFLRSRDEKSVGEAIGEFFSENNKIYRYFKDEMKL